MLPRRVFRLTIILGLIACLFTGAVRAQDSLAPRYRLTLVSGGTTLDQCRVRFEVGVNNSGGMPADTVQLVLLLNGQELAVVDVPPVRTGSQPVYPLEATIQGIPVGLQGFTLDLRLNGFDYADTPAIETSLDIPTMPPSCANQGRQNFFIDIPFVNVRIDLLNPTVDELAFLGGIVLGVFAILLLPLVILRRLTRRPPVFGNQLPPYATTPPLDPHSEAGVRHSWQMAAQNNLISVNPSPQALASVKLLTGANGKYLDGWDLTAVRLSQYDQYGRVNRSVTLADARTVRMLNQLAHNRRMLEMTDLEKRTTLIEKRVTAIGRKLADSLTKRITPRSSVLPIALDLRLRGEHGEVKIVFQLFQCENDSRTWRELRHWEPDMMVTVGAIYETYTYTIHGQTHTETPKEFKRRLPLEISRMLGDFVTPPSEG